MTTNLIHFKNIKKAKVIKKDLEDILNVLNLAITSLSRYTIYNPAIDSLIALKKNKKHIQINIEKCNKIILKKGVLSDG